MPPKGKKRKIIWNNNDCKSEACKRPECKFFSLIIFNDDHEKDINNNYYTTFLEDLNAFPELIC